MALCNRNTYYSLLVCTLWAIAALAQTASAEETKQIPIYSYLESEPYHSNKASRDGLDIELVNAFNQSPELTETFSLVLKSRSELTELLQANEPAIALWGNPHWFSLIEQPLYWSRPIVQDKSVLVSLKGRGFTSSQFEDLAGLRVGRRSGFYNPRLDELVSDKIVKHKFADSHAENIQQLLDKEVDVIIIDKASMLYIAITNRLVDKLEIVGEPLRLRYRHILVTEHYREYLPAINQLIDKTFKDDRLHQRLSLFGLEYIDEDVPLQPER